MPESIVHIGLHEDDLLLFILEENAVHLDDHPSVQSICFHTLPVVAQVANVMAIGTHHTSCGTPSPPRRMGVGVFNRNFMLGGFIKRKHVIINIK